MHSKVNLELKHRCSDFRAIRTILKNIGAKKDIVKQQKDYFFRLLFRDNRDFARLKLRIEGGTQTLIYYERPDFVLAKSTTARIKLYEVQDKRLLPFLISSFGVIAIIHKKREVWRKAHTVFHLDRVKHVGHIFEIELQKKGKITERDKKTFKSYREKLLPVLGEAVRSSNVDLVQKNNKRRSIAT